MIEAKTTGRDSSYGREKEKQIDLTLDLRLRGNNNFTGPTSCPLNCRFIPISGLFGGT